MAKEKDKETKSGANELVAIIKEETKVADLDDVAKLKAELEKLKEENEKLKAANHLHSTHVDHKDAPKTKWLARIESTPWFVVECEHPHEVRDAFLKAAGIIKTSEDVVTKECDQSLAKGPYFGP